MMFRTAVCGALLLFFGGCAGQAPLVSSPQVSVVNSDALPAPGPADVAISEPVYLVGPYDKLSISVLGIEELTMKVVVDGSGKISLPLAGTIDAGGHTLADVGAAIARNLRAQYVRDPQVAVNLEETVSHTVTVDGDVTEPGMYPVIGNMTMLQAIAKAKGATEFAKLTDVVVLRTVNGQRMAALYNVAAIRRGAYADPRIYANDIVIVGDSPARRLFRDIVQAAPLLTTPLIVLFRK